MTKITIEIDSGAIQSTTGVSGAPSQTPQGSGLPAVPGVSPPPDVLAQAAATGAINAGPGPSMTDIAQASAPIASSVGGMTTVSSSDVVSGGAAAQRVFGMQQNSTPGRSQ
jgi:hypothetical protein